MGNSYIKPLIWIFIPDIYENKPLMRIYIGMNLGLGKRGLSKGNSYIKPLIWFFIPILPWKQKGILEWFPQPNGRERDVGLDWHPRPNEQRVITSKRARTILQSYSWESCTMQKRGKETLGTDFSCVWERGKRTGV